MPYNLSTDGVFSCTIPVNEMLPLSLSVSLCVEPDSRRVSWQIGESAKLDHLYLTMMYNKGALLFSEFVNLWASIGYAGQEFSNSAVEPEENHLICAR